ncbi:MAG: hypothetical protein ACLFTT_08965 [Candidatus Hydrogenedentota bacterium]
MRLHVLTIWIAAALLLAGCGIELLTGAATQAELQKRAAKNATDQLDHAGENMGRVKLERAIRTYHAAKGAYPPSLEDLVPGFLPSLPTKSDGSAYGYDPATGQVFERPRPPGPDPRDLQTLTAVKEAIDAYGRDTGYYPPTLDALVPRYRHKRPRTVDGEELVYNNQNGYVALPGNAGAAQRPTQDMRQHGARGGAGPMGEAMTGIGMQQELGNQSSAGANAGGDHGRRSMDSTTRQHNQRAEEVLRWTE